MRVLVDEPKFWCKHYFRRALEPPEIRESREPNFMVPSLCCRRQLRYRHSKGTRCKTDLGGSSKTVPVCKPVCACVYTQGIAAVFQWRVGIVKQDVAGDEGKRDEGGGMEGSEVWGPEVGASDQALISQWHVSSSN